MLFLIKSFILNFLINVFKILVNSFHLSNGKNCLSGGWPVDKRTRATQSFCWKKYFFKSTYLKKLSFNEPVLIIKFDNQLSFVWEMIDNLLGKKIINYFTSKICYCWKSCILSENIKSWETYVPLDLSIFFFKKIRIKICLFKI